MGQLIGWLVTMARWKMIRKSFFMMMLNGNIFGALCLLMEPGQYQVLLMNMEI